MTTSVLINNSVGKDQKRFSTVTLHFEDFRARNPRRLFFILYSMSNREG